MHKCHREVNIKQKQCLNITQMQHHTNIPSVQTRLPAAGVTNPWSLQVPHAGKAWHFFLHILYMSVMVSLQETAAEARQNNPSHLILV